MNRKALITLLALVAGSPVVQAAEDTATMTVVTELTYHPVEVAAPHTSTAWRELNGAQDAYRGEVIEQRAAEVIDQEITNEIARVQSISATVGREHLDQLRRELLEDLRVEAITAVLMDSDATLTKLRRSLADADRANGSESKL